MKARNMFELVGVRLMEEQLKATDFETITAVDGWVRARNVYDEIARAWVDDQPAQDPQLNITAVVRRLKSAMVASRRKHEDVGYYVSSDDIDDAVNELEQEGGKNEPFPKRKQSKPKPDSLNTSGTVQSGVNAKEGR